jgi:hypothetical protein
VCRRRPAIGSLSATGPVSGAAAAASDPEALTGSDLAVPHLRFARRVSKCSSAGLDIGPLPGPPGACGRT